MAIVVSTVLAGALAFGWGDWWSVQHGGTVPAASEPVRGGYRLAPPASLDGLRGGPGPDASQSPGSAVDRFLAAHRVDRIYGDPVDDGFELSAYNGLPAANPQETLRQLQATNRQNSETAAFAKVTAMDPGPHGGAMDCGSTSDSGFTTAFCFWADETSQVTLYAYGRADYATPSRLAALARRIRAEDETPIGRATRSSRAARA